MRVTFLAYREWALKAIENIRLSGIIDIIDVVRSEEEYKNIVLKYPNGYVDCIILIGWSWIIKDDVLDRFLCLGIHPSDLPNFRGGSPIQHQIIAGIEKTKISLMTIAMGGCDVGDIWLKEDWDLSGTTMKEILSALSDSTKKLLLSFFEGADELHPMKQDLTMGSFYKRRKPSESRVSWEDLSKMSLKETYNLIRALGDPYPNIYVEDDMGNRLYFKEVKYEKKI